MSVSEMALTQGLRDTRGALERWNREPAAVLRPWFLCALGIGAGLLGAVFVVATVAQPDLTPLVIPGIAFPAGAGDVLHVLARNGLVLALHAVACVAGFIAGSSLPLQAGRMQGWRRWVHEKARPLAFGWVVLVTCFSLLTQAIALGLTGSQLAEQLAISPGLLMLTVFPHAILELTAVFLPLAAWTIASRRQEWQDLLAATFATVAFAIPMLVVAASWESFVWPHLLQQASPVLA